MLFISDRRTAPRDNFIFSTDIDDLTKYDTAFLSYLISKELLAKF